MINNFNKKGKTLDENSFVVKIIRKFERFEFYVLALLILIILLFSLRISGLDILTTSIMSVLATLYFFTAFAPTPVLPNPEKALFMIKLAGIGSAVAVVGIMFAMLNWPGSNRMLIAGGLTHVVCLFYSFAIKINDEGFNNRLKNIRIRCTVLALICTVFFAVSPEKLIELGFKRVHLKNSTISVQDTLNHSLPQ